MGTTKKEYAEQQKTKAMKLLKEVLKKLEKGQLEVVSAGWWVEGTQDRYTFQFHLKDSES